MTHELLLNIINKGSYAYIELVAITFTTILGWFITFKLGYKILDIQITVFKTLGPLFIMTLNCLWGRQFIPIWIFGIEQLSLITILLQVTSKVSILKSIWSAIIICLSCFASDFLIINPLAMHPQIRFFLFKTGLGYSVCNILEALIPAIFLLLLTHFPLPVLPHFQDRFKKRNTLRVTSIILTFYWVWCTFVRFLESFLKNPQRIPSDIISEGLAALGAIFIIAFNYVDINKEFNEELQHHEELQHQNELKIQKLEEQNRTLNQTIEELSFVKISPQELGETVSNTIAQLQKVQEANQTLIDQLRPLEPTEPPHETIERKNVYLSPIEVEVLTLIGQGKTNQEIANELKKKESYIRGIVSRLYEKLEIHDRGALAVYAIKAGYNKLTTQ